MSKEGQQTKLRAFSSPLAIRDNLNSILVPFERCIVLLHTNFKDGSLVFHHLLALQLAGEGMLELSNLHIALGFTLSLLGKLPFNFTAPLARITQLGRADLQTAISSIVLDQEPETCNILTYKPLSYLGSLFGTSLPLWYHLTLASGLSTLHLRLTFLLVFPFTSFSPFAIPYSGSAAALDNLENELNGAKEHFVLTFNLKVTLAGEIVAFSDDTSVTTSVLHLWVLYGQCVGAILFIRVH